MKANSGVPSAAIEIGCLSAKNAFVFPAKRRARQGQLPAHQLSRNVVELVPLSQKPIAFCIRQ